MRFGTRPPPALHGQCSETFLYSPYSNTIPTSLPYDLSRLHLEKNILSKGLADCVTYLKALREKQSKCVRHLSEQTSLPQKKKKRLQQTKRHLESEIKNRQLAEQAFLNNLQACETNIYLANLKAYTLSNASWQTSGSTSASTLYAPTLCSNSGSEATDLTWEGWTDEAVLSPFQKKSSIPFSLEDVAPDMCREDLRRDSAIAKDVKRPPPIGRDAMELSTLIPAPPNTAYSQYSCSSFLSPAAPVFKPNYSGVVQHGSFPHSILQQFSMSNSPAADTIDLSPTYCLIGRQTSGRRASQTYPQKEARPPMPRQRTKSL